MSVGEELAELLEQRLLVSKGGLGNKVVVQTERGGAAVSGSKVG